MCFEQIAHVEEVHRMHLPKTARRNRLEPESVVGQEIVFDDVDWIGIELDQDNVQWQTPVYYSVH